MNFIYGTFLLALGAGVFVNTVGLLIKPEWVVVIGVLATCVLFYYGSRFIFAEIATFFRKSK